MNTLVIGGDGYIGAHLVRQLVATGRRITILSRSAKPQNILSNNVFYVSGDYAQRDLICRLLDAHNEVIHLAYASIPNVSYENPFDDLLQNLHPTLQLFLESANRKVKLVLVSSGGTVYGEAKECPIPESHLTKPISPYGVTKLTLESYAYLYSVIYGLKYVCVRPSNAYGVGQYPFTGQGFIATAIASGIRGLPIKIYGDYGTVRDYLYVSDVANGIVRVLEYGHLSETYNIGSGVGFSNAAVLEFIKKLLLKNGINLLLENLPERPFDVKVNVLDSNKLQTHTGWIPKVDFNDGLIRTYDWLRNL
jgi:UDP-glucose 4-epimerase